MREWVITNICNKILFNKKILPYKSFLDHPQIKPINRLYFNALLKNIDYQGFKISQ